MHEVVKLVDPVAAYDRIAPIYARLADARRAYLGAVDRLVIAGIPSGSRSLLDVGAGDGARAAHIAAETGIREVTLLEPSEAMLCRCSAGVTVWRMRAENLGTEQGSFDAITCLWNVLGHVLPDTARIEALRQFARLVTPRGRIFIDLNHRYNAPHYGYAATAVRWLRDRFSRAGANGDVRVAWDLGGRECATTGHVFTHPEFLELSCAAGLAIDRRFVIDYATGEIRPHSFEGHLMYVLRRG